MSRTFAFIGSRPDLAGLVSRAHESLLTIVPDAGHGAAWGAGYFQSDELLLQRRPDDPRRPIHLGAELADLRTHALLVHTCDTKVGALRTETTPPLRYGHLLFACQGPEAHHARLRQPVSELLPDFLKSSLRGDTFTELAFSLFLAALTSSDRARTRHGSTVERVAPLTVDALKQGLRSTLGTLDELCKQTDVPRFDGDLWLLTSERLVIAHRQGTLLLRVYRGRSDLGAMSGRSVSSSGSAQGGGSVARDDERSLEHGTFTVAVSGDVKPPDGWERLPSEHILTASRAQPPETEAL